MKVGIKRKFKVWVLLSAIICTCSFVLLITLGTLSSELHWLYFSGADFTPSNYLIYYTEQVLAGVILVSIISIAIWAITSMVVILKEEVSKEVN